MRGQSWKLLWAALLVQAFVLPVAMAEPIDCPVEVEPMVSVAPVYPRRAQTRGIEGFVVLAFDVSTAGSVVEPVVVEASPPGIFDRAAQNAVLGYVYAPFLSNGEAVEAIGCQVRVDFLLDENPDPDPNPTTRPGPLVGAALPGARVYDSNRGAAATFFGTVINTGDATATDCGLSLDPSVDASFSYQTTNSVDNSLSGIADQPIDVPAGAAQSFLFQLIPRSTFSVAEATIIYDCSNTEPAPTFSGINTVRITSVDAPSPDVVAITLTATGDGIAHFPTANGAVAVAMATVNVGSAGNVVVSANNSTPGGSVVSTLCQTNPSDGECLEPPSEVVVVTMGENATMTFSFFLSSSEIIPLDPVHNRTVIQFSTEESAPVRGGVIRTEVGQSSFALFTDS